MDRKGKGREIVPREPAPEQRMEYDPNKYFRPGAQQASQRTTSPPTSRAQVNWSDRRAQSLIATIQRDPGPSNRRELRQPQESRERAPTSTDRSGVARPILQEQTEPLAESPSRQPPQLSNRSSEGIRSPNETRILSEVFRNEQPEGDRTRKTNEGESNVDMINRSTHTPRTQHYPTFGEFPHPQPQLPNRGGYSGNINHRNGFQSTPNSDNYQPERQSAGQRGRGGHRGRGRGNGNRGGAHQFSHNQQSTNGQFPGGTNGESSRGSGCSFRNCNCGIHHPPVDGRGNIVRPVLPTERQLERQVECDRQLSTVLRVSRAPYTGRPVESGTFLGKHPDYHHETSEAAYPDLEDTENIINGLRLPGSEEQQATAIERAQSICNSIDTLGHQIETPSSSTVPETLTNEDLTFCFFGEFMNLLSVLEEVHNNLPEDLRPFPRRELPEFVRTALFAPRQEAAPQISPAQNTPVHDEAPPEANVVGCLYCANDPCTCIDSRSNEPLPKPQTLRAEAPSYIATEKEPSEPDDSGYTSAVSNGVEKLHNSGTFEDDVNKWSQALFYQPKETKTRDPAIECDCMWCEDGYHTLCLVKNKQVTVMKEFPADTWLQEKKGQGFPENNGGRILQEPLPVKDPCCPFCGERFCWTCNMGVDSPGGDGDDDDSSTSDDDSSTVDGNSDSSDGGNDDNDDDEEESKQEEEESNQPPDYPSYLENFKLQPQEKDTGEKMPPNEKEPSEELTLAEYMECLIDTENTEEARLPRLPTTCSSSDFSEDWTTTHLHSTADSSSSDDETQTQRGPQNNHSREEEITDGETDITITEPIRSDLSYLFTYNHQPMMLRPTSPSDFTEYWEPALLPSTLRNPFRCLAQPTTRKLDADRVRLQTLQAVLCLLCIFEQDWEQYAQIQFSMMPYGDGWRYIHARHMEDYYGDAWFGEHDRAYRLGSMSEKMIRRVEIFRRPAWNVEHNYL